MCQGARLHPAMILRLPQSNWTEDRSHPLNLISDMVLRDTYEMISSLLSSLVPKWCKNIAKIVKLQCCFFLSMKNPHLQLRNCINGNRMVVFAEPWKDF